MMSSSRWARRERQVAQGPQPAEADADRAAHQRFSVGGIGGTSRGWGSNQRFSQETPASPLGTSTDRISSRPRDQVEIGQVQAASASKLNASAAITGP
jgi:hypothetical protein